LVKLEDNGLENYLSAIAHWAGKTVKLLRKGDLELRARFI